MNNNQNNIERILCAAIKRIEPRKCKSKPYNNNDILDIELGFRHHDILNRFEGEVKTDLNSQGFYTSKGRFVGRIQAMAIAYAANQVSTKIAYSENKIINPNMSKIEIYYANLGFAKLFSEDLY